MDLISEITEHLDIDWNRMEDVHAKASTIFELICRDPENLEELVGGVQASERLYELSEHYDILDKLVLADFPEQGVRLRLHVFADGYFDRPHNHRWAYASRILSGAYLHRTFACPVSTLDQGVKVSSLPVTQVQKLRAGDSYVLGTESIHSITADPGTVTLVLRGPARSDRFLVMDRVNDTSWWQYGRATETEAQISAKRMSDDRFAMAVSRLKSASLVSHTFSINDVSEAA